jgi:hypothetical protein
VFERLGFGAAVRQVQRKESGLRAGDLLLDVSRVVARRPAQSAVSGCDDYTLPCQWIDCQPSGAAEVAISWPLQFKQCCPDLAVDARARRTLTGGHSVLEVVVVDRTRAQPAM